MRQFSVALLFILVMACSHNPPLPPPAPPCDSSALCGAAGACPEPNCKTPVPPPPVCDPSLECGKPNACQPPDCKPVPPAPPPPPPPADRVIDHTREISYGQYAIFGDPALDPVAYAAALAKTHFTKVSLHIRSPWNNKTGTYDVTYFGTAYDLGTWNGKWYDWLDALIDALWHQGITVEICFLDQYSDTQWQKYHAYPFKKHPFQNNTARKIYSAFTAYQNWNKGDIKKPTSFSWLQWTTDANDHVLTATPTSPLGRNLMPMITRVAQRLGEVHKKHPAGILHVRLGNEPYNKCDDGFQNCESHLGVDPRVEDWMLHQFVDAGFVIGKTLRGVKNDQVYKLGTWDYNLDCTAKNYYWCLTHDGGWIYELHGIDSAGPNTGSTIEKAVNAFVTAHGRKFNPALLDLTNDGIDDNVSDAVARQIIKTTKSAAEAKASDNDAGHGTINQVLATQIANADRNVNH